MRLGEFIPVTDAHGRTWKVQRHYRALHGLVESELCRLGFEQIVREPLPEGGRSMIVGKDMVMMVQAGTGQSASLKKIVATRPTGDKAKWVLLECGHEVLAYGDVLIAQGEVFCLKCEADAYEARIKQPL